MKILITGNMGYVGSILVRHLRSVWPTAQLVGFDAGYFGHCLTSVPALPETGLDAQFFGDVRNFPAGLLEGVDAVVQLAAVSNDLMGKEFETAAHAVNHRAAVAIAKLAKAAGVKALVQASSCSVYGSAEDIPRKEDSALDPLTAYAVSKVAAEQDLAPLGDSRFKVTSLRFATACGMSDRLRLDLVLNDFVHTAATTGTIQILSDGTPWRPLIHVGDMARAIEWAISRDAAAGGNALIINVGSRVWNYQVKELAQAVAEALPGTQVCVNPNAAPDKRSYRVDFSLFERLAPNHQPQWTLQAAIENLHCGCAGLGEAAPFKRINTLKSLRAKGLLTDDLRWQSAV